MKRTLSLFLAVLTLLSTVAVTACSDSTTNTDNGNVTQVVSDTAETTADTSNLSDAELRRLIPDNLPDRNFEGKTFRVACEENKLFEITSEDLTGEVTNDAIYNRNLAIEERFGAKVEAIEVTDAHNQVKTTVTSGSDDYDIVGFKAYLSYVPITAKVLQNWYDIPYVNLDQPWYNTITNNAATFNGKLFNNTCSLGITQMQYTYAMFFNSKICEEYGYPATDLYNMVYNNEWVYDNFYKLVSSVYKDENGNGKVDPKDLLAFSCGNSHPLDVWLASFDQPITGKDKDGNVTVLVNTEKTYAALEKIYDLIYNTPTIYFYSNEYSEFKLFAGNTVAICPMPFRVAYSELRDMTDPYGILPYPKWDSEQSMYLTNIYDQYSAFGVPKTVPADNLEFVGIMFEALNAESYKTVYPQFYDVALKNKYSQDPDSANMVDIVMQGANMDFSFMFGESNMMRIPYFFRDLIVAKSTDFASKYAKIEKALNKQIDKLYTYYED